MNREQKLARIARAEKHARLDLLVAGSYIDNRNSSQLKGCSVGCDAIDIQIRNDVEIWDLVDENCHKIVAEHDGTPEWLEHLRDAVFEKLPADDRHWWHVEFAQCLPETDNWVAYYHRCCIVCLTESLSHQHRWQEPYKQVVVDAIEAVIALHRSESTDDAVWSAAQSIAELAWEATRSAAGPTGLAAKEAASAAWAAVRASTDPNGSVARSPRHIFAAEARSAVQPAAVKRIAEKLILEFARPK